MFATTVATLILISQQVGLPSLGSVGQNRDLLSEGVPGSVRSPELYIDGIRLARLARLDQLLALSEPQRESVLQLMRKDVRRVYASSTTNMRVDQLLNRERLKPLLSADQWRVFERWTRQGQPIRRTVDRTECRDAALLLAQRVASELKCDAGQRRRLEVASVGLAIRFRKSSVRQPSSPTRRSLAEDGTYVPLLEEMPFWSKSVAATVSADQKKTAAGFRTRRLSFYAEVNATLAAVDIESELALTKPETSRLQELLRNNLMQVPMFPFQEPTHPLLTLTKTQLEGILSSVHAQQLIELGRTERERIKKSQPAAKPADSGERENQNGPDK